MLTQNVYTEFAKVQFKALSLIIVFTGCAVFIDKSYRHSSVLQSVLECATVLINCLLPFLYVINRVGAQKPTMTMSAS